MRKLTIVLLFLLLGTICATSEEVEKVALAGAWLQTEVRWAKAPAEVNARLQSGKAAVLYFKADHSFALIYCVVNRVPGEYMTISRGDGQVVYLGQWEAAGDYIAVAHRLVRRTVQVTGEKLPGSREHATIKSSHAVLSLDRRTYHRTDALDESAAEVVNAAQRSVPASDEPHTRPSHKAAQREKCAKGASKSGLHRVKRPSAVLWNHRTANDPVATRRSGALGFLD
jgi:hypothetical protein